MEKLKYVGTSPQRLDAVEKVVGSAVFTSDVHPVGMLYGKVLGSPIAHGYIKSIDTSEAEKLEGVAAVVTGEDDKEERTIGAYLADRHMLCHKKVRYVGDFVAAVAATSEKTAKQALSLIKVEYEELPHVLTAEEAYDKKCSVRIHDDLANYKRLEFQNVSYTLDEEHPNMFLHKHDLYGDVEKGFEEAAVIVDEKYELPRASHCCMEPHVTVAIPKANGEMEVWASEQGGMMAKYTIAQCMDIKPSEVRLHIPYLGGGFGGKTGCPTTPIALMLAKKSGKPVKVLQTREEVFVSGNPRASGTVYVKDGYKKDGTLCARHIRAYINGGAYSTHSYVMINNSRHGGAGTYKCPNYRLDAIGVYTNSPPTGPYRALGSEMMVFAIERNVEKAAKLLGMDSYDLRMKNLLEDGDEDIHGHITYNNASKEALKQAAEHIKWKDRENGKKEGPWVYGKGLSIGNKYTRSGVGCSAICEVKDDGTVEIRVFHIEMGQGGFTVDAQAAAEEFDIPVERVKIIAQDSQNSPFDEGTYCSRGTWINGNAVILACKDAKRKMFEQASGLMHVPEHRLATKDGYIYEVDHESHRLGFDQLFQYGGWRREGPLIGMATYTPRPLEEDNETGIGDFVMFYSYGAWGIEVKVNIETGEVRIVDCGGYYDAGRVVNPQMCTAQIQGSFSMGLGQAIYEETMINDDGKVVNGNYRDYKIPTFMDGPYCDQLTVGFVGKPFRDGPNGAKGIGEVAMIPVMPAVANAIRNAVGAEIDQLPLSRERILKAIQKANRG